MHKIILKGSPKEIGQKHGETFRKEIRELCDIRIQLATNFFAGDLKLLKDYARAHLKNLIKEQDLFEEFTAIANASNVDPVDLMILNNYTDLRDFSATDDKPKNDGCSVIGIRNQSGTLAGQTWDMHASATPFTVFMELHESHTNTQIQVLSLTGCLGLAGINHHGVSVMINNMHCTQVNNGGLAWNALVRKVLRAKNSQEGVDVIHNNLPCSGHSYAICDKDSVVVLETTGLQAVVTDNISGAQQGVAIHTNHYVDAELKKHENIARQSKTTHARYASLEAFFKKTPPSSINIDQFQNEIFSTGPVADAICMKAPSDPHGPMTSGGLIVDFQKRKGLAFQGVYKDKNHIRFEF